MLTAIIRFGHTEQDTGVGTCPFEQPDRVLPPPDAIRSACILPDGASSYRLRCLYGDAADSIAPDDTIHAVRFYVRGRHGIGEPIIRIIECATLRAFAIYGDNLASPPIPLEATDATYAIVPSDTTPGPTLSAADVRDGGFGVSLRLDNATGNAEVSQAELDAVWAEVDFSRPNDGV